MRHYLMVMIVLAMAGCDSQTAILTGRTRYDGGVDAVIRFAPFDQARDRSAISECWAAYAKSAVTVMTEGSLTPADRKPILAQAMRGMKRIERLFPPINGDTLNNDNRYRAAGWINRHRFHGVDQGATISERKAFIDQLTPYLTQCDKALDAWGAPPVSVNEMLAEIAARDANMAAIRARNSKQID